MLEMLDITKQFPGVKALDRVTLNAENGKILGLIGINGAGKSTLMNILGGILKPDQGSIILNGKTLVMNSPKDAENNKIAFIHQEPLFFFSMTVVDNIYISRFYEGKVPGLVDRKRAEKEARKYLDMLGAAQISVKAKMEDISIGERQVIEIARALAMGADVIIFDEPTSSLSLNEKKNLFQVIERLKSEGKIIIYISHFLDEIKDLCDDYLVLRDGKMSGCGKVADVQKPDLVKMIIGQELGRIQKEDKNINARQAVLKVENIRSGNLLKGVNFELREGEVLGLWGLMGSGRTELLRAMTGLDRVDGGTVYLKVGNELKKVSKNKLLKACGYVTENRHADGLFLSMSIWENCTAASLPEYTQKPGGVMNTRKEVEDTEKLIKQLNIKVPNAAALAEQLSGGNQQKVIFSKWMNKNADVLFLDEPTRGVDVGSKLEIHKLVRQFAARGTAVLLVSSEIEEMVDLSDRVIVLKNGVITSEVTDGSINHNHLMELALGEGGQENE